MLSLHLPGPSLPAGFTRAPRLAHTSKCEGGPAGCQRGAILGSMTRTAWLVAIAFATGCGASASQVVRAKSVRYQADFPEVWDAVSEVVKSHYKRIKQEDATQGFIQTEWTAIEKKADAYATDNLNKSMGATSGDVNAAIVKHCCDTPDVLHHPKSQAKKGHFGVPSRSRKSPVPQ